MKVEERVGIQPRLPLGESSVATNEDGLTDEERRALGRKRGLFLRKVASNLSDRALNRSKKDIINNYSGNGTERFTFRDENGKLCEMFVTVGDIDWVLKIREQGRIKKS